MEKNEKSFSLIIKNSKAYSFAVTAFQVVNTLIFKTNDKIKLTFIPKFLIKPLLSLSAGKLVMAFNNKVRMGMTTTIGLKTSLVFGVHERLKAVAAITQKNPIIFNIKAIQKIFTIIYEGKLQLIITPLLVHFYTLGYFDPNPLSVEDSQTLGQMDFIVV